MCVETNPGPQSTTCITKQIDCMYQNMVVSMDGSAGMKALKFDYFNDSSLSELLKLQSHK